LKNRREELTVSEIVDAIEQLAEDIHQRENNLKKPVIADIMPFVLQTVKRENFSRKWNKDCCYSFYQTMGISDSDGHSLVNREELFRINIALSYVLSHLKQSIKLSVSYWPYVNLFPRQHLAIDREAESSERLNDYHHLLLTLISSHPNRGTSSEDLCARIILSMIALDGVVVRLADYRIAMLKKESFCLKQLKFVKIPMGKKNRHVFKQFPLCNYTQNCLRFLLQRAKSDGSIFSDSWVVAKDHKKTKRRQILERMLHDIWFQTFPDRDIPEYLDVKYWIKESRCSLEILGVPYICIASLTNKIHGAQLPMNHSVNSNNISIPAEIQDEAEDDILNFHLLDQFHKEIKKFDKKEPVKKVGNVLSVKFDKQLRCWRGEGLYNKNEELIAQWLIWMLRQKTFADLTLSTFKGYLSIISNRVVPLLDKSSFLSLSEDAWKHLAELVVDNPDYMPSSRRQALAHMEKFHYFLMKISDDVPDIDFKDYRYRIVRDFAECDVIFPHEVDRLLDSLNSNSETWLGILFAFYCGLRCEEICYLRIDDLSDEYRLVIGRSKLESSTRTLPYGMLIPKKYLGVLRALITRREGDGQVYLICDGSSIPILTDTLSKRIGRLLKRNGCRVQKMHALRHGFASWQLVRYYMLVDPEFKAFMMDGRIHHDIDASHCWFSQEMLAQFAEVIGGIPWRAHFLEHGRCLSTSTDLVPISKLLGHVNRFTTLENYTNSLGWLNCYYLNRRLKRISSLN